MVQVGPATLPIEQPVPAAKLPKPTISLTAEQWGKLPRDVQEILVKRELQWDGLYRDYLSRP